MDYYNILGLNKNCTQDEIKKAYKTLALQYHPDRSTQNKEYNEKRFKEISEAYQILSDTDLRYKYDNNFTYNRDFINPILLFTNLFTKLYPEILGYLDIIGRGDYRELIEKMENSCINDLLSFPIELFIHILKKQESLNKQRRDNIEKIPKQIKFSLREGKADIKKVQIEIDLEYYYRHPFKRIILNLKKRSNMDNRGLIDVEREFILNLTLEEQLFEFGGNEDLTNLYPGDILFVIKDKEHNTFKRHNQYNLIYECNINFTEFVRGFMYKISHFDKDINIDIKEPWKSFMVYKISGYGMKNFDNNTFGDMIIKIIIGPKIKNRDIKLSNCIEPKIISLI